MRKAFCIGAFLMSLFGAFDQPGTAEELRKPSSFLGAYRGPEIPGYKIVESNIAVLSRAARYESNEVDYARVVSEMFVDACKQKGAVGVVNMHVDMHFTKVLWNGSLSDPGIYILVQGDCVYKAKPLER